MDIDFDSFIFNENVQSFENLEDYCNLDDLDEVYNSVPNSIKLTTINQEDQIFGSGFKKLPPNSSHSQIEVKTENDSSGCSSASSSSDFNPDDFLNFIHDGSGDENNVKGDPLRFNERNTPSPSASDTSNDSNRVLNTFGTLATSRTGNILLDTPPISPQNIYAINNQNNVIYNNLTSQISPISQSNSINNNDNLIISKNTLYNNTQSNIISSSAQNNTKGKTIVLSSNDFKNLMQRCKTEHGVPNIILKGGKNDGSNVNNYEFSKNISSSGKFIKPILPKIESQSEEWSVKDSFIPDKIDSPIIGIVDEKTLKKHERMIKNRKSASLSRLKKKDYVASLEIRIKQLENENKNLKEQNLILFDQVERFTKFCQCNLSQTISKKRKLSDVVFFNEKESSKGNDNRVFSNLNKFAQISNVRKNTAVLLAMVFMLSLNFGFSWFTPQQNDLYKIDIPIHHGRGLLWINDSIVNNATNQTDLPIYQYKKILKNSKNKTFSSCRTFINQTENLRLASELRKWIDVIEYQNISSMVGPLQKKYLMEKDIKKIVNEIEDFDEFLKKSRQNYFNPNAFRRKISRKLRQKQKNNINLSSKENFIEKENSIDIFQPPKPNDKYSKFFEEINRRDDTFYLVSFKTDHILLPASAYNKSSRPKISLMLPASNSFEYGSNGKFTLMQIDCEVLNTTMIELDSNLIPKDLKPNRATDKNSKRSSVQEEKLNLKKMDPKEQFENETKSNDDSIKLFKPFFIKKNSLTNYTTLSKKIKKNISNNFMP